MVNLIYMDGSGHKAARPVTTREDYVTQRNAAENVRNFLDARGGDERAKGSQVQYCYNDLLPDGVLRGCCHPSSTFAHDIDCGDPGEQARIREVLLERKDEIGLLELSGSARYGLHAVCRRQPGRTIRECQYALSMATQTEYDTNSRGLARVLFTGPATPDNLFYLDDAIFQEPLTTEESAAEFQRLKERETAGLEEVPPEAKKANKHYRPWEQNPTQTLPPPTEEHGEGRQDTFPTSYKGTPYTDIIQKYWELFNEGKEPTRGDRDTLTYQLACDLRHICGRNAEWLDQVIPCYDGFPQEEKRKKIQSALQAKMEGMPYRLKQVMAALKSSNIVKACGGTMTSPPPLPRRLPPLIRLLTKNVPALYKPAVASTVFPALGVHLHGVRFRYWDNVEHEPTFMSVLVGRQSIGKGSIKKPIEYIMEDIRQRDLPNRQRESDWKQKNPGSRPKKDPRPADICIQMLIDNLTDAVFNQRIVDANNNGQRFVFTIVDEIEALKKVTSKGTADEVGLLIRKAFDNSLAGQERVGADSVSGIAPLRWNFNASTTPPNARKFLYKMINDGTISRLDIATIIKSDSNDDKPPILGIYDHTFAQELKPYIDRLEAASGLIECSQAKKLSMEMRQENSDIAKLYDSEAYEILSYRANVIAWLKGMVLYVAHGYKWSREIADFVHWSQQYNLWCKMLYFGRQLDKELREEMDIQKQRGPTNLLEELPDEFTEEDYMRMRQAQGRPNDGGATLRSWKNRGHIIFDEATGRYCKTAEYKQKYAKS